MVTTITVNYTRDGDDWTVTVAGGDQQQSDRAPGLIAARDRADTLVESIVSEEQERAVVHMIDGDAFAFTTAYLRARHGTPNARRSGDETAAAGTTAGESPAERAHESADQLADQQ